MHSPAKPFRMCSPTDPQNFTSASSVRTILYSGTTTPSSSVPWFPCVSLSSSLDHSFFPYSSIFVLRLFLPSLQLSHVSSYRLFCVSSGPVQVAIRAVPRRNDFYNHIAQGGSVDKLDEEMAKWLTALEAIVIRMSAFLKGGGYGNV